MISPFAATLVAIGLLVAAAPTAHAGTYLSWELCRNNQPGTLADVALAVVDGTPADYGYRSSRRIGPGTPLRDGDVLRIRARGMMTSGSWPVQRSDSPAGSSSERLTTSWGNAWLPKYGLYGYFAATGRAFWIGTDSGCVVYRGPETWLWLPQNDDYLLDNRGRWDITVRHYHL
jgi:hypothetical protein